MKLNILPLAVACTGLVASASPMRVILVSSSTGTVNTGPVAQMERPAAPVWHAVQPAAAHPPCAGSRIRQKVTSFSQAFKIAFGFKSTTNTEHAHLVEIKPYPFIGTPVPHIEAPHIKGIKGIEKLRIMQAPVPHHAHVHGEGHPRFRHHQHAKEEHSFLMRVHFALMSLGPWEGRAVAFVLGCGIGVLLRMFWVMAVLSYRMIKGPRPGSEDEDEYTFIDSLDAEEIFVAPPTYTYPVDEKSEPIAVVVPAPAAAAESK
ncbi:hypothetical protein C8R46DRAFT_1194027 [Mycena filopes]|nr:hypothetical protein C8R46DRAFT_1194027 [Mycena filopes]